MMEGRMTKTGNAATGADMAPPIQSLGDVELFWQQTQGWIASHYLSIAIACASGALIIALLYGLRMLGTRLCRREHLGHWPRIVGRAIARTNLFFIVMLAARLVSGYATPPAVVAGTIGFLFTVATAVQAALWVRELVIGIVEYRAGRRTAVRPRSARRSASSACSSPRSASSSRPC